MKKILTFLLAGIFLLSLAGCGKSSSTNQAGGEFKPKKSVDWIVTSSPGGGSDIYTRVIADIMTKGKIVEQTFLVNNQTDGGGEVGRANVSQVKKGDQANHTLLTFNSGDLMPMVKNTPNRIENFTPIAIMAVDNQLLLKGTKTKYKDFKEAIDAAKAGTPVIIGGSKGDDIATYEKLLKELGLTEKQMTYVTYNSTSEALTSILGGHVEFVISKPAASSQYVEAKTLIPVLALATKRFTGNLADAPKLSEIGNYKDVSVPVWRGVAGPKDMSPEAADFWSKALKQVSDSEQWKKDYIEKNKLVPEYMDRAAAAAFMKKYQEDYKAAEGIK